jgi:adenosylcobinamide kinase/adenosylcobinamide-phosphate guanylyltransferase
MKWIKGKQRMPDNSSLSLVIGGASSGKSSFAETYVKSLAGPRFYLATAQAYDDEMEAKISAHQKDRAADGWQTVEAPIDVTNAIQAMPEDARILVDCATMWLNNLIMDKRDLVSETEKLVAFLANAPQQITVVSNEVGLGIVPENKLARQFRIAQGHLNALLASRCGLVVVVMAGLPMALKGQLP